MDGKARVFAFILALFGAAGPLRGDSPAERMAEEFARFTNAVVVIDDGGAREMHRLARGDGDSLWASAGFAVVDLKGRRAVWNSLGESGADGFGGLFGFNAILVHIPEGADRAAARFPDGDVAVFEVWKGWRRLCPNDSWLDFTMQSDYKPYYADAPAEMYYDWPGREGRPSRGARLRLFPPTGLWVMRTTTRDGRIFWDFGYRPPPTREEAMAELRRELERMRKERKGNLPH